MATHSSILAWRIPWTEEPGGLQRIRHNYACTYTHTHTTSIFMELLMKIILIIQFNITFTYMCVCKHVTHNPDTKVKRGSEGGS